MVELLSILDVYKIKLKYYTWSSSEGSFVSCLDADLPTKLLLEIAWRPPAAWREDLSFLAQEAADQHPDLLHHVSQDAWHDDEVIWVEARESELRPWNERRPERRFWMATLPELGGAPVDPPAESPDEGRGPRASPPPTADRWPRPPPEVFHGPNRRVETWLATAHSLLTTSPP